MPARKYSVDHKYFREINNGECAYWLGFLAADGHVFLVKKRPSGIQVTLKASDINHLEKMKKSIKSNAPIIYDRGQPKVSICSSQLARDLVAHGLTSPKSLTLEFPSIPREFISDFVLGYFDGDGSIWIETKTRKVRISFCGTEAFLSHLARVIHKECEVRVATIHKNGARSFRIQYGNNIAYSVLTWMYTSSTAISLESLDRKRVSFERL